MSYCLFRPIFSPKIFFFRSQIVSSGGSMNTSRSISSILAPALSQELALPHCPCQDMVLDYIFYLNLHISPSMLWIHCPIHVGSILVSPILHNPTYLPHCRKENLELCFQNFFLIRYCAQWQCFHGVLPPSTSSLSKTPSALAWSIMSSRLTYLLSFIFVFLANIHLLQSNNI